MAPQITMPLMPICAALGLQQPLTFFASLVWNKWVGATTYTLTCSR